MFLCINFILVNFIMFVAWPHDAVITVLTIVNICTLFYMNNKTNFNGFAIYVTQPKLMFFLIFLSMLHNVQTNWCHYGDVIMGAIACQIASLTIVYSTVYSDADQRKHLSPASLAFVWGNSPVPVTREMFHLMTSWPISTSTEAFSAMFTAVDWPLTWWKLFATFVNKVDTVLICSNKRVAMKLESRMQ